MTRTPHKHAEAIRAWANGEEIEYRVPNHSDSEWVLTDQPAFVEDYEYRVKPARSYPVSTMTTKEAIQLNHEVAERKHAAWSEDVIYTVNAGLRHAIDNGQVVTREELALAIGDRERRDWIVAEEVKRACILTLGAHTGQHLHSQTVLRGLNLAPIIEGMKK